MTAVDKAIDAIGNLRKVRDRMLKTRVLKAMKRKWSCVVCHRVVDVGDPALGVYFSRGGGYNAVACAGCATLVKR